MGQMDRQTNRQTDARPLHRLCFAYYAVGGAALWQPRFARLVRISVYEHVCRRRTSLSLRQADSLVLSVCVGALGIDFCGVQQRRPPCWQGLSTRPAMRDD